MWPRVIARTGIILYQNNDNVNAPHYREPEEEEKEEEEDEQLTGEL